MNKTLRFLDANFDRYLCIILFGSMVMLACLQVLFRFVLNYSLDWTEELARYCFIASIYAGAALGVKDDQHIRVEAVNLLLPKMAQKWLRFFADSIWLIFSIYIMIQGFEIYSVLLKSGQTSPTLRIPMGMVYGIIPIGFLLMSIRLIQSLWKMWIKEIYNKKASWNFTFYKHFK
ncbi:MAG: hypothetical protein APF76_18160 [Desulfitibacter sp. BRH_c19]|nr:MAG: hypothetical protein APF76_18160 [Desulfitibacter sp. BRH_c19]